MRRPSERRAFDQALPGVRCPNCNKKNLRAFQYVTPITYCPDCGQARIADVTFTQKPIPGGFRTVATVTFEESP
jgi:hypothetical protein